MARAQIPADIDRDDRVLAGLTARQLAIVTLAAAATWGLFLPAVRLLPLPVATAVAAPPLLAGVALALGRRDGLPADRLALAAVRQRLAPRRRVLAPGGVAAQPAWATSRGGAALPAPLDFPAHGLDRGGVLDLGGDGAALVCAASPLNFGLRTHAEQDALVAGFARFLHAVTAPVQVVVRAERVDLHATTAALTDAAGGLPHPALEAAARDHAGFLADLAARRDVLHRQILVVFRDPAGPAQAAVVLAHRAEEAASLLAAAGITLTPLDGAAAAATLARAASPDAPAHPPGLAAPSEPITGVTR
jgi:hypothetical protein